MTEWTEINDEDEIRTMCECGYVGVWQDRIRGAYDEQDQHRRCHEPWTVEILP